MKNKKITLKGNSSAVKAGWVLPGEEVKIVDEMMIPKPPNRVDVLYFVENKNKNRIAVYHDDIEVIESE